MPEIPERVIDLHEDVADYYMSESPGNEFSKDIPERQADLPKYKKARMSIVVASLFALTRTWNQQLSTHLSAGYGRLFRAYVPKGPHGVALEQLKVYYQMCKAFPDSLRLIEKKADLEGYLKSEQIGFLVCLEGTEPLEDASDLELFFKLGARGTGLTWNFDTRFAASCMSKRDYGLTGEGERLVEEANEMGVILDLAHASKNTMLSSLGLSRRPVMISHANYSGVHKQTRNVDDDVLEKLSQNHGVIGFTMITDTIGPSPGIDALANHIMAVRERYGSDLLAIGTDYLGIILRPAGLEDVSKLGDLFSRLGTLGMRDEEIRKLAWQNAYRVFGENSQRWPS